MAFLAEIGDPEVGSMRAEAEAFLRAPGNRRKYFLLECGEIFEMEEDSMAEQNERLFDEIVELPGEMRSGVPGMSVNVDALGLGNWSNDLYFDPGGQD
jgi:hypothetical protein